ncbi:MAG: hypothetical protein WC872_02005 [Candidatus Absconditabacterales bacterium]
MKKFAFVPTKSITDFYGGLINKYKRSESLVNIFKLSFLMLAFFVCLFVYVYFVNQSSTSGYFLRKENQKLSIVNFQFDILKTKLLAYKQQNRESIYNTDYKREVIDVQAEVVKIPSIMQLSKN